MDRSEFAQDLKNKVSGMRVLITGGLGMIGSNIAHLLARGGVEVSIVDACLEPY